MDLRGGLGIRTAVSWYPPGHMTARQAESDALLSAEDVARLGVRRLPVSELAPPEMAVRAGREALAKARMPATMLDLVVHAWIHHQGHDFWSPPHYIADELGAVAALPFGIQQMCNGGSVALQTAAAHLLADSGLRYALATTADRFAEPGFARWNGDYGVVYGDAATAVLLHRTPRQDDVLHLLSVATVAAPGLELVHRGDDAFSTAPGRHSDTVDVRRTKKAFLAEHGSDRLTSVTAESVRHVVRQALDDARVAPDDPRLRHVLLPRLGRAAIENAYLPGLADLPQGTIREFGADTGHVGAGDTPANLADLVASGLIAPGELAVAVSGGGGFSWSAVVVRAPKR